MIWNCMGQMRHTWALCWTWTSIGNSAQDGQSNLTKKGNVHSLTGTELPNWDFIKHIEEEYYNYFCVLECKNTMVKEMKDQLRMKYFRWLTFVLHSKLTIENKI